MLETIASSLAKHKLVPFFGAGVSAPQLRVLWKDVAEEMADAVGLPPNRRDDFLAVADEFVAKKGNDALAELLRSHFIASSFDDVKGWSHLFLLSLNAGVLYTTNQDNLFELAAAEKGRPHRVIARLEDLAESSPGERFLIKYHGDLAYPDTVVFTGASYRARIAETRHFLNIRMQADLLAKGFLFVGYSFRDPNIHLLFQELRAAFGEKLPPSYLIAYHYDAAIEELHRDFGVVIVNPMTTYRDAANHDEAFKRYLKALSEQVLALQSADEISNLFTPSTPPSIRVATEFDISTVVAASKDRGFDDALSTYRSLLDRTAIPLGLEQDVFQAFRRLCDAARSNKDLAALAGAVFNLSLPASEALQAISGLMVAINRIDETRGFPGFMIISPAHPDELVLLAATLAVAEIKRDGGIVREAFRAHAESMMVTFPKLPPDKQKMVRETMEAAWRDGGLQVPIGMFDRTNSFAAKSFSEICADLTRMLPNMLKRPPV